MTPELLGVFAVAEVERRGLNPDEIAYVINSTPRGSEARAEALAIINGGRASTAEGRNALLKVLEADSAIATEHAEHRAKQDAYAAEKRALVESNGFTGAAFRANAEADVEGESEWRGLLPSASEFRTLVAEGTPAAGGYAVPNKTASEYVEYLRAASVFLRAKGINIHRFDGATFTLPSLTGSSTPGVAAEGATITEGSATFAGISFSPVKYADLYRASNEVIADGAVDMRNLIAGVMTRNVATQVDKDAFQGTGTASLSGLTKAGMGTAVNLTAGNTVVKWSDVINAYSDVEAVGGTPGVIWASPDMAKALRAERENGATGGFLAGNVTDPVTKQGLGLPLYVSANLPVRTVIVADPTRIHLGVRSDVQVAMSEQFEFAKDLTAWRLTWRIAGLAVDNAAAVQVIKASAS
jgi:HK97 family phage major capsid protein